MHAVSKFSALGALMAASLLAQGPRGNGGTPPDPATMVANRVARLTTLLSLTTAQAAQATTIFTNSVTASSALQTTLATDRTSLQAAVKSDATSTIDQLAATIGTLNGQILGIQSKADAAFYALLTTDQKTKYDQLGGGGPGGFGGPGGPGPHGRGGPPPGE